MKKIISIIMASAMFSISCITSPHNSLTVMGAENKLGDVNGDNAVDAADASCILQEYAVLSTGGSGIFTDIQKIAADVNDDGTIDSSDASSILAYYAYLSTGGTINDIREWMEAIRRYSKFDISMTWEEAEAYCESIGGHLAVITSAEEQELVNTLFNKYSKNCYWLGAHRIDGEWHWINGEDFEYQNWAPNEPNNQDNNENFIHLFGQVWTGGKGIKNIGEWNDASGSGASYANEFYAIENFGFICEWDS